MKQVPKFFNTAGPIQADISNAIYKEIISRVTWNINVKK